MDKVWTMFPKLTRVARKLHENAGLAAGHHPFEHALMVGQYCLIIALKKRVGILAARAALLHNTDRFLPKEAVEPFVRGALESTRDEASESDADIEIEVDALLNHHKMNNAADSAVLVCLKDADRLANISPFEIIARAARHYPVLPLFDPRFVVKIDPNSTYHEPGTVFRDAVQSSLEWESWLRLPKAKELAKPYFDGLRQIQELTHRQLLETELDKFTA